MLVERRSLLLAASGLAAATASPAWSQSFAAGVFTHGVASGDPLSDSVILWTRFVSGGNGQIGWEIAEDEAFASVAQRGQIVARPQNDYCAKVDVRGLNPGRRYFYRFLSASGPSETGRTLTAPRGGVDSLTIALFSCSNFPFGYFHSYGLAAERADVDLAVHVGDYIYEVARGVYPSAAEAVPGRIIDPTNEIVSYADYCQRYATYHTDAGLLALRRNKPISVVWDDHEIANNTWREGAQAHDPATECPFATRLANAAKAYFDWMPIRRPDPRAVRIYRSLDWGDLARIVLLDTRYIGRDQEIDLRTTFMPMMAQGGVDARQAAAQFRAEFLDVESRTLLGRPQEQWFAETLAQSKAQGQTWQVIAQQVVMGEQKAPAEIVNLLPDNISAGSRQWFTAGAQLAALGLPWNMDAWGGYAAARRRFLEACASNSNNAIVLGGDSHNCWVNNLRAPSGDRLAAIEFAGGSVSSPGFEGSLSKAEPGQRESMIRGANPDMAFCDLTNRGFAVLKFTRETCTAEWNAIPIAQNRLPQRVTPIVSRMVSTASAAAGPGAWAVEA